MFYPVEDTNCKFLLPSEPPEPSEFYIINYESNIVTTWRASCLPIYLPILCGTAILSLF